MSIGEEAGGLATSESFWEIGQYKRTVKRIDDGSKLCQDLMSLIKERGDIETAYAKQLRQWSKKWSDHVEKGPEYGTMEGGWKGVLEEADKRCDLHSRIRDRLVEEVYNTVKMWQKENYHQKALSGLKESKEMEEAFRKAQKPWAKLYLKVDKAKKDYHSACKAEKTAINQDKNASGDSSVSLDQQKKLTDRVERLRDEKEKAKTSYEQALNEINAANAKYMEDMTQVFEKCQEMELKRLKFFKEMLFGIHKCLDLSQEPKLPGIYKDYWATVESSNGPEDLKWWAETFGTGMAMNWPTFEEYSPEFRRINKKQARLPTPAAETETTNGVMLIGQKQTEATPTSSSAGPNRPKTVQNGHPVVNGPSAAPPGGRRESSGTPQSPSPFDQDWDEPENAALEDTGEPGVQVKALYDYKPQEEDELLLKKGDIFEKLEDEDEQGWCKGRKDGKVGLYPANYAQAT